MSQSPSSSDLPNHALSPETDPNALNERHKQRMKRKKKLIDAHIQASQKESGLVVLTMGNGKGKSSSGFGMVARALGHGMKVGVVQFIKGMIPTGEEHFFKRFPDEVEFFVMGEGYTWDTQDRERDIAKAAEGWAIAKRMLSSPDVGLVLLDEINIALQYKYLQVQDVLEALAQRPSHQHVVLTGRGAPPELIEFAHTVTDMKPIKHAYEAGFKAQPGIEF